MEILFPKCFVMSSRILRSGSSYGVEGRAAEASPDSSPPADSGNLEPWDSEEPVQQPIDDESGRDSELLLVGERLQRLEDMFMHFMTKFDQQDQQESVSGSQLPPQCPRWLSPTPRVGLGGSPFAKEMTRLGESLHKIVTFLEGRWRILGTKRPVKRTI